MIDLSEVRKRILGATPVLGGERVGLLEALGRVLIQDIVVAEDFPAADISAMDGYAVRHAFLQTVSNQTPALFRIIGESAAGQPFSARVGDGQAVQIMTGGVIPEGADTVINLEKTVEQGGCFRCISIPECGVFDKRATRSSRGR